MKSEYVKAAFSEENAAFGADSGTRFVFSFPSEKKIMELPPSSWRQADVHRTSVFDRFESIPGETKKRPEGLFYWCG